MMGTKPELETTVTGTMSDGSKQEGTIDWKLKKMCTIILVSTFWMEQ